MTDYCGKCGSAMEFRARPTGKFDHFTGTPSQHEYQVCPNWRPILFFDNGHDWHHRGINPIDGVMPIGPDPMLHENAPSPRGAIRPIPGVGPSVDTRGLRPYPRP